MYGTNSYGTTTYTGFVTATSIPQPVGKRTWTYLDLSESHEAEEESNHLFLRSALLVVAPAEIPPKKRIWVHLAIDIQEQQDIDEGLHNDHHIFFRQSLLGITAEGRLSRLSLEVPSSEDPSSALLSRLSLEVLVFTLRQPLYIPRKAWPSTAFSLPYLRTFFTHPNLPPHLANLFVQLFSRLSRQESRQEILNYRTLEEYSRGTHTHGIPRLNWRSHTITTIRVEMTKSGFTLDEIHQYSEPLVGMFDGDARQERTNYTAINQYLLNSGSLTIPHKNYLTRRLDHLLPQMVKRGVPEITAKALIQCIHRWRVSQSHDERLNYHVIEKWANN